MGHATKNKKTKLYSLDDDGIEKADALYRVEQVMIADGSYNENKEDPLVRVVGPEHGGRSRTVSQIIGYTKVHGGLFKNVNYGRNSIRQVDTCTDGHVNYPPIMVIYFNCLLYICTCILKMLNGLAERNPM
ncbi:uncharacterized protein LOC143553211 [Bidens hawaiensis]|uniref:uncharacterized protein LOC143553211 n=1 Tax=Bidens hawaiensis TaxID=980011 RepID=UPI00404A4A97